MPIDNNVLTDKAGEPEKNSDRRPESDGVRRVGNCHQGHVMRHQPVASVAQGTWQPRLIIPSEISDCGT